MFALQDLLKKNTNQIAHTITIEQGKTLEDAKGSFIHSFFPFSLLSSLSLPFDFSLSDC
jgi:acyl-CoA reductase-like NAD-dependent aldehyde dehydrogenase